jgi:redox-sensitive bicupin YhaK (pirin superfamily)
LNYTAEVIDTRPAAERFHTRVGWLDSRHSFSFGHHHDPTNTNHGLLLVSNDDRVAAGGGFSAHPHENMEIVTWVLEGRLEHRDSAGHEGVISPGLAQRMSAGSGVVHSEMNHSSTEPVHFIQMWVPPDVRDVEPGYEQRDLNEALATGELTTVASGRDGGGAVTIHQNDAVLHAARPSVDQALSLPVAPHVHLFVARGRVRLDDHELAAGDAARLTDHESVTVVATEPDTELLVWATS